MSLEIDRNRKNAFLRLNGEMTQCCECTQGYPRIFLHFSTAIMGHESKKLIKSAFYKCIRTF